LAGLYQSVNSGVVRIETTTCNGGGIGTGFLVAPSLIATVAHVVDGAAAMSLTLGDNGSGGRTSGVVVGIDPQVDVALIRTNRPLTGHVFPIATQEPKVGQEIGAIGFPEGEPMTLTRGIVSGLDRTVPIDGMDRTGMIQTDAAINPGNSGGPMLTVDGRVYGLIDAKRTDASGIAYAVSPTIAAARLGVWKTSTRSVVSAGCANPIAPPAASAGPLTPPGGDARSAAVGAVFQDYFDAINTADYSRAWSHLTHRLGGASPDNLAAGDATSFDGLINLASVSFTSSGSARAHLTFTSFQAAANGPNGDTCDIWDLDYTLVQSAGTWLIDGVKGHGGGPTHTTC
jgi:S1-C subfamily serine protease